MNVVKVAPRKIRHGGRESYLSREDDVFGNKDLRTNDACGVEAAEAMHSWGLGT